jgi:hypothetical protein
MLENKHKWITTVTSEGFTSLASLIFILLLLIAVLDGCFDGSNNSVDATPGREISGSVVYSGDLDIAGTQELFYSTLGGIDQRKISGNMTIDNGLDEFKLSPDYRYAAYRAIDYQESILEFYVTRIADGKVVKVSPPHSEDEHYYFRDGWDWSPDSKYLKYTTTKAYEDNGDTTFVNTLYIVSLDGNVKAKIAGLALDKKSVWSPGSSHIYYISNNDTYSWWIELHLIGPDATNTTQFIDTEVMVGQVSDVQWSPEGSWLAYLGMDQQYKLFTVRPDGSDNNKVDSTVTEGSHVTGYKWSPDGSRLAYRAYAKGITDQYELYTAKPDGSGSVKVSGSLSAGENVESGLENIDSFQWSPDSRNLAYIIKQDADNTYDIYSVLAVGVDKIKINQQVNKGIIFLCEWSSNGANINYITTESLGDGLYTLAKYLASIDGSVNLAYDTTNVFVSSDPRAHFEPWCSRTGTLSPDGSALLYTYRGDIITHTVIAADGSGSTPLMLEDYTRVWGWEWSPDSQYISAWGIKDYTDPLESDELFTIKPDGSKFMKVSKPVKTERSYRYQWSADSAYLAYMVHMDSPDSAWDDYNLYSVSPNGNNHTLLNKQTLTGYAQDPSFVWHPSTGSQQVVYHATPYLSAAPALFSTKPDGTEHTTLNGVPVPGSAGVNSDFVVFNTPELQD